MKVFSIQVSEQEILQALEAAVKDTFAPLEFRLTGLEPHEDDETLYSAEGEIIERGRIGNAGTRSNDECKANEGTANKES